MSRISKKGQLTTDRQNNIENYIFFQLQYTIFFSQQKPKRENFNSGVNKNANEQHSNYPEFSKLYSAAYSSLESTFSYVRAKIEFMLIKMAKM